MTMIERIEKIITGLQLLLEFLKAHPILAKKIHIYAPSFTLNVWGDENKMLRKEFSLYARELSSGVRKLKKEYNDYSCKVERKFGPLISLSISISREQVCERVVTGVKFIPGYVVPETTEEVVEWRCK